MDKMMNEIEIKKMLIDADIKVLDVRPSLAQGVDPFHLIMGEVAKLQEDEVLHLINGFEPKPLYNVLGSRGYEHFTEFADGAFNVYFFKPVTQSTAKGIATSGQWHSHKQVTGDAQRETGNESAPLPDKVVELDVRGMEPPEPMMAILKKIHEIDEDTVLLVHHHREPMMLYEKLEDIGWKAIAEKIEENYYKVVITRKAN